MKKVFISHSDADKNTALLICENLEKNNIDCWIAPRDISYGKDWSGEISNAIENSSLFVFLLSKNSNESTQCPKEIAVADNAGIPIICIKIDNCDLNPGYKYHFLLQQILSVDVCCLEEKMSEIIFSVRSNINAAQENNTIENNDVTKSKKQRHTESNRLNKLSSLWVVFALFMVLPVLHILVNAFGYSKNIPPILTEFSERFPVNPLISLVCIIMAMITFIAIRFSFDYQKKYYADCNLGDEFFGDFHLFVNRLIELSKKDIVSKKCNIEDNELFSYMYDFDRLKVASSTGETVDYFSVIFTKVSNPFCWFFFLDNMVPKRAAINYLIKQGFNFSGKEKNVIHFSKEDVHLRIACKRFFPGLSGLEFVRKDIESNLKERIENESLFYLPEDIINEYKSLTKKEKGYALISLAIMIIFFIFMWIIFI